MSRPSRHAAPPAIRSGHRVEQEDRGAWRPDGRGFRGIEYAGYLPEPMPASVAGRAVAILQARRRAAGRYAPGEAEERLSRDAHAPEPAGDPAEAVRRAVRRLIEDFQSRRTWQWAAAGHATEDDDE